MTVCSPLNAVIQNTNKSVEQVESQYPSDITGSCKHPCNLLRKIGRVCGCRDMYNDRRGTEHACISRDTNCLRMFMSMTSSSSHSSNTPIRIEI